jgi:hypothetical protein
MQCVFFETRVATKVRRSLLFRMIQRLNRTSHAVNDSSNCAKQTLRTLQEVSDE